MALQYCPKCKKLSFTWYLDEEQTSLTQWCCQCGYYALEDENKQRDCPVCGTEKAYSYMIDTKNKYWWCCKCGKTEVIEILTSPTSRKFERSVTRA
jgi:transcription elongation factor Elf1